MAFGFLHYSMLCLLITLQARLLHLFWLVTLFLLLWISQTFESAELTNFFVTTVHIATLGEALCLFGQNDEHLMMARPTVGFCHMSVKVVVVPSCGGLTLAGCQVPTKATLSLPSSTGQGRENKTKGLWVEIRTRRDHSPITVTGKTDSTWGKISLIYC